MCATRINRQIHAAQLGCAFVGAALLFATTSLAQAREERVAAAASTVVLSNGPDSPDPFQTFLEVVDIYLGGEGASGLRESADPQAIARWAGEYAAKSGLPVRLVASGATLEASIAGGPLYPLTPISDSEFSGIAPWGASFRITFDPDGDLAMLSLYGTSRLQRIEPSYSSARSRRFCPGVTLSRPTPRGDANDRSTRFDSRETDMDYR
jgi:hypothetical protein